MSMAERSVHIVISGRVQGVGYRAWLEEAARAAQLRGWVRNCRDGSVEAVMCGPGAMVDTVLAQARQGPPAARVDGIAIEDTPVPQVAGFAVLPTA